MLQPRQPRFVEDEMFLVRASRLIYAGLSVALVAANSPVRASESFDAALKAHLTAISQKDYPGLVGTITTGPRLDLYFPDGRHLQSREDYLTFHRSWFAERSWSMRFKPVNILVGMDITVATVRSHYEDMANGTPQVGENWLTLTFRKEGSEWRLVADQNTRTAQDGR